MKDTDEQPDGRTAQGRYVWRSAELPCLLQVAALTSRYLHLISNLEALQALFFPVLWSLYYIGMTDCIIGYWLSIQPSAPFALTGLGPLITWLFLLATCPHLEAFQEHTREWCHWNKRCFYHSGNSKGFRIWWLYYSGNYKILRSSVLGTRFKDQLSEQKIFLRSLS